MSVGRGWKLLLAIDTSAGTSTAVFDGDSLLAFVEYDDPFGHAENIGNAIAEALDKAKLAASQISAVAIGRGPAFGSDHPGLQAARRQGQCRGRRASEAH